MDIIFGWWVIYAFYLLHLYLLQLIIRLLVGLFFQTQVRIRQNFLDWRKFRPSLWTLCCITSKLLTHLLFWYYFLGDRGFFLWQLDILFRIKGRLVRFQVQRIRDSLIIGWNILRYTRFGHNFSFAFLVELVEKFWFLNCNHIQGCDSVNIALTLAWTFTGFEILSLADRFRIFL